MIFLEIFPFVYQLTLSEWKNIWRLQNGRSTTMGTPAHLLLPTAFDFGVVAKCPHLNGASILESLRVTVSIFPGHINMASAKKK